MKSCGCVRPKWGFPVRTLMTALLPAPQVPGEAPQGRSRQGRGERRDKPQRTRTRKRSVRPELWGVSGARGTARKPTTHPHPPAHPRPEATAHLITRGNRKLSSVVNATPPTCTPNVVTNASRIPIPGASDRNNVPRVATPRASADC